MAQTTASFQSMINAEREKKKREDLAQRMLGSRRSSTGGPALQGKKGGAGGVGASLASRVGITKTIQRSQSAAPKPNIDGQWTHDLHDVGGRRASRPSATVTSGRDRNDRLAVGLQRELSGTNGTASQANIRKAPNGPSMSIRGIATPQQQAGPYVVIASNFAPGTTAADIEAAMAPVGGEADGRLLYVYLKAGGPTPGLHPLHNTPKAKPLSPAPVKEVAAEAVMPKDETMMDLDEDKAPRRDDRRRYDDRDRYRDYRGGYSDGRAGFGDRRDEPRGYDRRPRGLYSDNMYRGDNYRR